MPACGKGASFLICDVALCVVAWYKQVSKHQGHFTVEKGLGIRGRKKQKKRK